MSEDFVVKGRTENIYEKWGSENIERAPGKIRVLESLGLSVKKINEFDDLNQIRDLAEIIKQDEYVDYNTHYFNIGNHGL